MTEQHAKYDKDLLELFSNLIDNVTERTIFGILLTKTEDDQLDDIINSLEKENDDQD